MKLAQNDHTVRLILVLLLTFQLTTDIMTTDTNLCEAGTNI